MSIYFVLKVVHILSAAVLFGTGIGIAFFKWSIDRGSDIGAVRAVMERVVLADWIFTGVAVVVQPLTGIVMARIAGWPLTSGWVGISLLLYALIGLCWLPVVFLQIKMRDLARAAERGSRALPPDYWRFRRQWFWLGVPAFSMLILVYVLMVLKPA